MLFLILVGRRWTEFWAREFGLLQYHVYIVLPMIIVLPDSMVVTVASVNGVSKKLQLGLIALNCFEYDSPAKLYDSPFDLYIS